MFPEEEQIEVAAAFEQPAHRRRTEPGAEAGQFRLAGDDLADVVPTRHSQQRYSDVRPGSADHYCTETAGQRDILFELGCDEFQGFFYARPMTAGMLLDWSTGARPAGAVEFSPSTMQSATV